MNADLFFSFYLYLLDSAKLVGPWSMTNGKVGGPVKNMGGPIKLLYVIMFKILKCCQKCIFGPVKCKIILWCLWMSHYICYTIVIL